MTHTIDHARAREAVHELAGLAETHEGPAQDAYSRSMLCLLAAVGADTLGDLDAAAEAMLKTKAALRMHTEAISLETLHWLNGTETACFEGWRAGKQESARRLREVGIDQYGRRDADDALPGSVDDVALDGYGDS